MTSTQKRRRTTPVLWAGGVLAALALVLGVNGTLASWSTAILTNDTNTVKAADAKVLTETDGTNTCVSTDNNDGSNSYTCSTINKYGGTATPLAPGTNQATTVTMTNTGTASGSLTLAPGTCVKSAGSASATQSICDVATVTIKCTAPSSLDTTGTPVALSSFGSQTVGTLAAGASTQCTFTVAVPATASPQIAGQIATQPLVWTLA
ncbi:hypothetical protein [Nocardioides baekrokdamisoli]|nr:hypothetical protein [Nocardioides baekrokdamisoli]